MPKQETRMGLILVFRFASLSLVILVFGCSFIPSGSFQPSTTHELVFGYIQVETTGANSRGYPTNVRFISLGNTDTGERFRIDVNSDSEVFSVRLPVGHYSVDRVQFNEGPFMAESHVQFEFQVPPKRAIYLGVWQFAVETPRTVRLVRIHFVEGDTGFQKEISARILSETTPIETVLPKPNIFETRMFSVAPHPKVKYFYRQ